MGLKIWLPLNGNLNNQGLENISITNNGAVSNDNGKIGKCYYFNSATMVLPSYSTTRSICFWLKAPLVNSTIAMVDYKSSLAFGFGSSGSILVKSNANSLAVYTNTNFTPNQWIHVTLTRDDALSDIKLYLNGVQQTARGTASYWTHSADGCYLGGRSTGNTMTCYMNDFRVYDHELSQKEISEIAKGLMIHYKLDGGGWGNPNLLINTDYHFQTTKTSGWDTDKNGTLMAGSWGGFNGGVTNAATVYHAHLALFQNEYVYDYTKTADETWLGISQGGLQNLITSGKQYTFSCEIYRTEGSANRLGTGLYYYKTGATSASFHLGIQYSNSTMPANSWQKFTYTFTAPSDADYTKAISWYCYGHYGSTGTFYLRHIKLEEGSTATAWELTANEGTFPAAVYDHSGYNYQGTPNAITLSNDSGRYSQSSIFNGSSSYIKVEDNTWMTGDMTDFTVSVWMKASSWPTEIRPYCCLESGGFGLGNQGSSGYYRFYVHEYTNAAQTTSAYDVNTKALKIADLSTTTWNHVVIVHTNTDTKTYLNGALHYTYTHTNYGVHFNTAARLFLGCEAGGSNPYTPYFNGQLSDFRLYATALSAAAIKDLYDTSAEIDNKGNLFVREVVER